MKMTKYLFNMNYKEQLKTSAWLKKRSEILTRDNFVCSNCLKDNYESTLEVHHLVYLKGRKAWEYSDYLLVTLCRDCHQQEHDEDNTSKLSKIMQWVNKFL